jgi:hypothetical protein
MVTTEDRMGLLNFRNRQTGEIVQAEFPLHPGLVAIKSSDGQTDLGQLFRPDFDKLYEQQLPDLPAVNPANIDREAKPAVALSERLGAYGKPVAFFEDIPQAAPLPATPGSDLSVLLRIADELELLSGRVDSIEQTVATLARRVEEAGIGRKLDALGEIANEIRQDIGTIRDLVVPPPPLPPTSEPPKS